MLMHDVQSILYTVHTGLLCFVLLCLYDQCLVDLISSFAHISLSCTELTLKDMGKTMCIITRVHCTGSYVYELPYCGIVGNTSHVYTVPYGGIKDNSNTWKSHAIPPPRLSIIYCDLSTLVSDMFRGIVEVSWIMKSAPAKMYPPAHSGEPTSNIAITIPAFNLSVVNSSWPGGLAKMGHF